MLRRFYFLQNESRRLILKSSFSSHQLKNIYKLHCKLAFVKLPRFSRLPQSHSRCSISGRSYGVKTKYALSRFAFRYFSNNGRLPLIRRAS